jgi:microcystin degradation protein MlrC
MRVAVATLSNETNTFASGRTTFDEFTVAEGPNLLGSFAEGRSLEGIVETLRDGDAEVVPTVGFRNLPSPTVAGDAFDRMVDRIREHLTDKRVDGVCLDLHGSMFVDGQSDPEGKFLSVVRQLVGPDVPVTAALDMHATVTERMVEHLDGIAAYRTAPHTDVVETGCRAADMLLTDLSGGADLRLNWQRVPMLLAGERSETEAEPMATLVDDLRETETDTDGVYSADYLLGFPWADSPHAGCHAVVTTDADAGIDGQGLAADLASSFWERRREFEFTTEAHDIEGALDEVAAATVRPVVVADTGDIPGAGASEDVTNLLRAMLAREDLGRPVVAPMADERSLSACLDEGDGGSVSLSLGRLVPSGDPLDVSGTVETTLADDPDEPDAALVALDRADVVITRTRSNRHRDPDFLRSLGVEPVSRSAVVLKSGYLSPTWKDLAGRRLFALTPGDTNQSLDELPYERVPRPIYPLDPGTEWSP